ncbi:unnamed protein product [Cuscuta campestris]|uniref:Uncharacterized protein n=1 Tax=Cuscuta campestris TaxID=132261 RepID=A0A484KMI4_9ASTE|nr:unnamed protein product [Cuscuta campestris]
MAKKRRESEVLYEGLTRGDIRQDLRWQIEEVGVMYPESIAYWSDVPPLVQKEFYPDIKDYYALKELVMDELNNEVPRSDDEEEEEEGFMRPEVFGPVDLSGCSSASIPFYDKWVPVQVSGTRPEPRAWHGAAVMGDKLYIYGGRSRDGCFLGDLHVLDLNSWTWHELIGTDPGVNGDVKSNIYAAHSLIAWKERLLLIVGHTMDPSQEWNISPYLQLILQLAATYAYYYEQSNACLDFKTSGDAPIARGGHSVNLFGNRLVIFGGEDARKAFKFNDVHILDLVSRIWRKLDARGQPPYPRVDHVAALHKERYLLIFGGSPHYIWFDDLHVLDLEKEVWSGPKDTTDFPTGPYGRAGATMGDSWFIVGGGTHKKGADTCILNMPDYSLSVLPNTGQNISAGIMGLSLVVSTYCGEIVLLSFGGAEEFCYKNDVHVLKLSRYLVSNVDFDTNANFDPRKTQKAEWSDKAESSNAASDNHHANVFSVMEDIEHLRDQLAVKQSRNAKLE